MILRMRLFLACFFIDTAWNDWQRLHRIPRDRSISLNI